MTVRTFFNVVEIRTKVVGISTFLLGTLYAVYSGSGFDPVLFVLMSVSVFAVDMGTTAFNTFFDFLRGTDDRAFNRERDKVLVHENVSPASALVVALALYALSAFTGLAVAFRTGPFIAVAGAAGMTVGFLYTGGPYPISRSPFGELFSGGFLGTVLFLVSFRVQSGYVDAAAAAASLPLFLSIAAILTVNNICDIEGDAASGRKTLSILMGKKRGEYLAYALVVLAHASVIVLWCLGLFPPFSGFAALVSLIRAGREVVRMHARGFSHETKGLSMKSIAGIFTGFSLLLMLSLFGGIVL